MTTTKAFNAASANNGNGKTTAGGFGDGEDQKREFSSDRLSENKGEDKNGTNHVEIFSTVQRGMEDYGWRWGINSADVIPDSKTEAIIGEHARATAEAAYRENFNPDTSLHDRHREEEFETWRGELVEAERALLNEKSRLKGLEATAAKAKATIQPEPEYPIALVVVAIPLVTLTVAFALFDSFVTSLGFILALTFSLLAGISWGAFITYLILHNLDPSEERRSWKNWTGLLCGIGMAIALGLIRYNQSSSEFLWLVVGLTLLEGCIVFGLDFYAQLYRLSLAAYWAQLFTANEAESDFEATKAEVRRREERTRELQNRIEAHLRYLDERELFANHKEQFIASAEKAAIAGYHAACAYNRGKNLK